MTRSRSTPVGRVAALAAVMARKHTEPPEITPPPQQVGRHPWAAWYRLEVTRLVEAGVDAAEARRRVQAVARQALRRARQPLRPDEPAAASDGADMRRVQQEIRELLAAGVIPVRETP